MQSQMVINTSSSGPTVMYFKFINLLCRILLDNWSLYLDIYEECYVGLLGEKNSEVIKVALAIIGSMKRDWLQASWFSSIICPKIVLRFYSCCSLLRSLHL